jgi:hypothetical protein
MFCNNCGQPITAGSAFCNRCGGHVADSGSRPPGTNGRLSVSRNTRNGGKWLVLLLLVIVLAIVYSSSSTTNPPDTQKENSGKEHEKRGADGSPPGAKVEEPKPSREAALANASIVKFTWHKAAFDTVMDANFTVRNNNDFPVKDLEITCEHSASSGTVIDHNTRTIYQVVPPHSIQSFRNFDMGFIHSQAASSGCVIADLVVMDRLADHEPGSTDGREIKDRTRRAVTASSKPGAVSGRPHALDAPVVVNQPDGPFSFRNLKIFPGCSNNERAVSEVAGVLDNKTGNAVTNTQFRITAHGASELKNDVGVTITFKRIEPGENPFDYTFASCPSVRTVSVSSYDISTLEGKP